MSSKIQRAIVVLEPGKAGIVNDKPYPSIAPNEIVVKIRAVTLNPSDYKHVDMWLQPGDSLGSDFAGDIVELGAEARNKGLKIGDPVGGFIRGGSPDKYNGSFAEYLKTLPELVWPKPENISYEEAASMGIALSTAVQAFYYRSLNVPKPWDPSPPSSSPILIWAASTAVGLYAISLAKLANVPIVATSSPRNFELLKSLGADAVFDYNDPDVVQKVRGWADANGGGLMRALDNVGSTELVARCVVKGANIVKIWPADDEFQYPGVDIEHIVIPTVLLPACVQDFADIQEWYAHLPELIKTGRVKCVVPLKVADTGLEGILEGIDLVRQGKVAASKLAYRL